MSNSARILLLCLEQQWRWRHDERIVVEAYFDRHPSLKDDPEGVLDLIYNEIVLREENGKPPELGEYLQRFPQFARELLSQFRVHEVIEQGCLDCLGLP